ncbi:MAG: hypothetical protein HRU77_06265 [Gammaproteobacteria bacterium]|nr:MAG: hypothetical protein HRU77_06265 [Gammaproteobacteria bacterium]
MDECMNCNGTGNCPMCEGTGLENGNKCGCCFGSGECPECDGTGEELDD